VSAVKSSHNGGGDTAAAGEKLQQEMLSPFVDIFPILPVEVR